MNHAATMRSILIIDDEIDFVAWLCRELEARGHEVRTANTVGGARDLLAARRPDLVIVGLAIENDDDGFYLCYFIKKADPTIPVILATSVTRETDFDFEVTTESERAWIKADTMLDRPFRFEQLEREMDQLWAARAE